MSNSSTFCQLSADITQMISPCQVQMLDCSSQPWEAHLLHLFWMAWISYPWFLLVSCACLHMHVCVLMGGGGCTCEYVCIQGAEYKLRYHFSAVIHLHFSLREGFSLTWNLQVRQHQLGRRSERSTWKGLQAHTTTPSFLYIGTGDQVRSLCLQGKHISRQAISLVPLESYLD